MKAMIFAAGLGTRLKPLTNQCPKALVKVNNKTLLEHNIRYLQQFGIYEVIINVHHYAQAIIDTVNDNDGFGSSITISDETDAVLETGGGLKKAADFFKTETDFVLLNVDVVTNLDLGKIITAHKDSDAIATLAVMKRNSTRQLLFDDAMQLYGWENNTTGEQRIVHSVLDFIPYPYSFSGISVLSNAVLQDIPFNGKFSLIDLYLHLAKQHTIMGYDHTGNVFIDVGKPDSIAKAEYFLSSGNT